MDDSDESVVAHCTPILDFLSALAPDDFQKDPLHVDLSTNMAIHLARLVQIAQTAVNVRTPKTMAYKISKWDVNIDVEQDWADLLPLQPVIGLDYHLRHYPLEPEELETLAVRLHLCFVPRHRSADPRRLFLSGVPRLLLAPEELRVTRDADADALRKLYSHVPKRSRPTWKNFISVIKLVEPEFWPSRGDLEAGFKSVCPIVRNIYADDVVLSQPLPTTTRKPRESGRIGCPGAVAF